MEDGELRLGVDLGGTKIESIVLARERVSTPAGDYRATLLSVAGLVGKLEAVSAASAMSALACRVHSRARPATSKIPILYA